MRAWILHDIGDLRPEETELPVTTEQEVLVQVKAAGICGSDIPRIYRTGAHTHPLIPGHEFSGVVTGVGDGVDEGWLGKRVGVFPLIPCGCCLPCENGQYEMCRNYGYLGSRRDGGFAEYVAVPAENLIELPDRVSFEEAAMLEPMAVAVHAMRRVELTSAKNVVICGLGTIGLLLVMFLLEAERQDNSHRLLVVGNKEFQRQTVLKLGVPADCYCDGSSQDAGAWIMEHTDGNGADVFFECVGKNETIVQAVDCAAPAGQICLVGNPYSDMQFQRDVYWKILRNQLTVTGTWNSSFGFGQNKADDWYYVLERLEQKRVSPEALISHKFPLAEIESGLRIMRDKTEDYVKIMGITGLDKGGRKI